MTTQTTFEYAEDLATQGVHDIIADLGEFANTETLAYLMGTGEFTAGDLEEDHLEEFECWNNIQDEIYGRLTDAELIPENFCEELPVESDELADYIDCQVESYLEEWIQDNA